jgi:hypothetical protein
MKSKFSVLLMGATVLGAGLLGAIYPERALLIAPHVITVMAILAGIIGATQSVVISRGEQRPEQSRQMSILRETESQGQLKALYDQLLMFVLTIIISLGLIWINPVTESTGLAVRIVAAVFMAMSSFSALLAIRMPGYLKAF